MNKSIKDIKECVKCGSPIPKEAYFCPLCKYSQVSCHDC